MPASSVTGTEASSTPSTSKVDAEHVLAVDKGVTPRNDEDCVDVTSKPAISDASAKDVVKDKAEKDEKSLMATSQLPPASDQKVALAALSASVIGAGASSTAPYVEVTSRVPPGEGTEGLPALLPGRVSLHVYMLLFVHLFSFSLARYICIVFN